MKRRKKLLSFLLSLALVVSMIPAFTVPADAAYDPPEKPVAWWNGTNVEWLPSEGTVYYVVQVFYVVEGHDPVRVMDAYISVEGTTIKEVIKRDGLALRGCKYDAEQGWFVLDGSNLIQYENDKYMFKVFACNFKDENHSASQSSNTTSELVLGSKLLSGYQSDNYPMNANITGPIHVQIKEIKAGDYPDFSATQDSKYCTIDNNGQQTVTYMVDGNTMMQSSWTFSSDHFYRVWANFTGSVINGKQYVFPSDLKVYINGKEAFLRVNGNGKTASAYCDFTPTGELSSTHTITFNANGGSGSMPSMSVADGDGILFPECKFTPPSGATFDGWKLSYSTTVEYPGHYSPRIFSDVIYYAVWKGGSVDTGETTTHFVNTNSLNVRAKPDSGSDRVGGLKYGDLVTLLDSDGDWFQINCRGMIGWVQNKFLDPVYAGGWRYPFTDITVGSYDYVPILWAYNAEPQVTNGMTDTLFGPKETVTRGQCVTFLWRAMGCPEPTNKNNPFVDVPSSQYYYKPILWAVEKGITKGTDATHFSPDQKLSTAHITTFLYRTLGKGSDGWFQEAGNWATANGLMDRTGLTVSPSVYCPRGAVVTFLYRTR